MIELITLFSCLSPLLDKTTLKQLSVITQALLMMTGRITMLGISRWAGKGGSYRTIQRFFNKNIHWEKLNWALSKPTLQEQNGVILIAGDATTVTKSGKKTFGLGRFFSSIYSRAVPGIAFQTLSLIDVGARCSWPILTEQMQPKTKKETKKENGKGKKNGKIGRPKGSKNKNRRDVELSAELLQIQRMLKKVLELIQNSFSVAYFVYDGAFGNNASVQMTRQVGLHLISKLRNNSALFFKWTGEYSGRGRPRIYGDRIDFQNLPSKKLQSEKICDGICTRIYHCLAMHKTFADPLNVVIILKRHLNTQKEARVILFSSDLELGWENLINYYRLRFQIEFTFRAAKQHWGMEDFMVINEQSVSNAANISLFMVNVSHLLLRCTGEKSVLDLKARYHGFCYAKEILKLVSKNTNTIIIEPLFEKIPILGRIHERKIGA